MSNSMLRRLMLACALLAFVQTAAAHTGTGLPGGFAAGFRHPFGGLDHLLAMVAVGIWGAILRRPLIYVLPVVFPMMMVFGAVLGMLTFPVPPVEIGVALSVCVLGACIGLLVKAPVWAATGIVAVFALFHGYAHGKELPSAADPLGYSAGFVLATGFLHLTGIAIGHLREQPFGEPVMRAAGVFITAVGVRYLYQGVAP